MLQVKDKGQHSTLTCRGSQEELNEKIKIKMNLILHENSIEDIHSEQIYQTCVSRIDYCYHLFMHSQSPPSSDGIECLVLLIIVF